MSEPELRELDAWIAEHVMGWQWWRFKLPKKATAKNAGKGFDEWCQLIPPNETWPSQPRWRGILCKCEIADMPNGTDLGFFNPTTSNAPAMQVLEKCAEHLAGGVYIRKGKRGDWSVCKYEDIEPRWATAPTLPLAIAQFARQIFKKPL